MKQFAWMKVKMVKSVSIWKCLYSRYLFKLFKLKISLWVSADFSRKKMSEIYSAAGYTKVCNHPKTIHKHPQRSTTTQKLLKKAKTCHKQWCYTTLDVHNERDVEFWYWYETIVYIYMCVCLCLYTLQVITLTIFGLGWLFVFVSIKSISFYVKSDDFYFLKIWILEVSFPLKELLSCSNVLM